MPSSKAFQSASQTSCKAAQCHQRPIGCRAEGQHSQDATRRSLLTAVAGISFAAVLPMTVQPAQAIGPLTSKGKKSSKKIPISEYSTLGALARHVMSTHAAQGAQGLLTDFVQTFADDGLKYYDLEAGSGNAVKKGDAVSVHFDVYYGILDVVSSRYATLLGKNELIPEPYDFTAGTATKERKAAKADGGIAGGSFAGASGPKPPPALSTAVIGMKKGGKRSVIVPPEQAYGSKGYDEIPADATIELQIEVL